MLFVLI